MAKQTGKKSASDSLQAEETFTRDEVQALIAKALKEQENKNDTKKKDEYVTLCYMGAIAKGTTVVLGSKLGQINRANTPRLFPKKDFIESLGQLTLDHLLQERSLVVLDGLTENERLRYGLLYKENEILSNRMFDRLLDLDVLTLKGIYTNLCESHKRTAAKIFLEAYFTNQDARVTMEKTKALNDISKTVEKDGLFTPVLEDMGARMIQ